MRLQRRAAYQALMQAAWETYQRPLFPRPNRRLGSRKALRWRIEDDPGPGR
jgi:hypothetical protein